MDFRFNNEQDMLREAAKKFFEKECPKSFVKEMIEDEKGYSQMMWQKMAELGWMGVIFDEIYGGVGGSFLDLCVILEEMGKALCPSPFFSTVILSGQLLQECASNIIKEKYLTPIARGEAISTFALPSEALNYPTEGIGFSAKQRGEAYKVSGTALFVPYAHVCNTLLCTAKTDGVKGITLFILDPNNLGFRVTPMKAIAGDKLCEVEVEGQEVPAEQIVGEIGKGMDYIERIWPKIMAAKCVETVGAIKAVLDMTVKYVNERHQFGRPLAGFQAIQHMCADMAIKWETSKYIAYQAAWRVSEGLPCQKEAAMARAWCAEAFKEATRIAHQAHGGIGITEEYDLYLFTRNAKSWELSLGDGDFHREVVAKYMKL